MTFTIEPSSPLKGMQLYEKIDLTKGPKITIKLKETADGPEHHIPNVPKNMIIKFSPHASRMWAAVFDRKDPKNHELNLGVRTDIDVNALKYLLNQMLRACQTQGLYYLQLYPTHLGRAVASYAALKALGILCVRSAWRHELVGWMRVAGLTHGEFVAVHRFVGEGEPGLVRHVLHQIVWTDATDSLGHPDMAQIDAYVADKPELAAVRTEVEREVRGVLASRQAKKKERRQLKGKRDINRLYGYGPQQGDGAYLADRNVSAWAAHVAHAAEGQPGEWDA